MSEKNCVASLHFINKVIVEKLNGQGCKRSLVANLSFTVMYETKSSSMGFGTSNNKKEI